MIEQQIYYLLQYLNIYRPWEIDIELIAYECKAEIQSTSLRSHCMAHPKKRGWKVLFIQTGLTLPEWREKVAHELIHHLLHSVSHLGISPYLMQHHESQADRISGYLLVPFFMFKHLDLHLMNHYQQGVNIIAEQFKVSQKLAERRLNEWNEHHRLEYHFGC